MYMLTTVPLAWTSEKVAEYFEVSLYTVRTARNLLQHNEIITMPPPRQEKTLVLFCDEFTCIMPGISEPSAMQTRSWNVRIISEPVLAFCYRH